MHCCPPLLEATQAEMSGFLNRPSPSYEMTSAVQALKPGALCRTGRAQEAEQAFAHMQTEGIWVTTDTVTVNYLLNALSVESEAAFERCGGITLLSRYPCLALTQPRQSASACTGSGQLLRSGHMHAVLNVAAQIGFECHTSDMPALCSRAYGQRNAYQVVEFQCDDNVVPFSGLWSSGSRG